METKYQIVNGTYYHEQTPVSVINILEKSRINQLRIKVYYGDTETGRDWEESCDVQGIVGRSMGPIKIPLMIHNSRSRGGPGMLDHCIVKIVTSLGKEVLYQHPKYH